MGIPFNSLSSNNQCNSFLEIPRQSLLDASTINRIALHPLAYLPHSLRNCTYPPISHIFIEIPPFFMYFTFSPIVGTVANGSFKESQFNKVVFPEFSNPIKTISNFYVVNNSHVLCVDTCLLYTSPSPRDRQKSRMPSSA
eukprot:TRINITY_DN4373_c0_g1_i1.p1 TRINITY_DN4373_c0_g1~~TRINITY_DN4373_c0_g1_i1.p1  ORF type:complete len:140 (+),score=12.41 TRINITY_DN4373_c0_g1_i1:212-631(+)